MASLKPVIGWGLKADTEALTSRQPERRKTNRAQKWFFLADTSIPAAHKRTKEGRSEVLEETDVHLTGAPSEAEAAASARGYKPPPL